MSEDGRLTLRLDGKVAIVVGAGSSGPGWGTGKAISVLFARQGAAVLGIDNKRAAVEDTAAIIGEEGGLFRSFIGDATSAADVKAALADCIAHFGRLDIVVNNLGMGGAGLVPETDADTWDRTFEINVKTAFLMCKEALPHLQRATRGAIINISSTASLCWMDAPSPSACYAASKAALNQFTQYLAREYAAKGIRANVIVPGMLVTPGLVGLLNERFPEQAEHMLRMRDGKSPTGKQGDAWDIAYAAAFLASDQARYINGVLLPVDGGLSF